MKPIRIGHKSFQALVLLLLVFSFPENYIYAQNNISNDRTKVIRVEQDVKIRNYFKFLDSIVAKCNQILPYNISEHILVRNNPWIIDLLTKTDYYYMMEKDSFVYDQKNMIIFKTGNKLIIPDSTETVQITKAFQNTRIDINIPEFKLRIYEDSILLHKFPVRVGRNEKKYLEMAGRIVDLRTIPGSGTIVGHVKDPVYYNPVDNHQYFLTKRDDERTTKLPQIPWLETEINGLQNGQLIHPTTNPVTLNKAYSNGCIGTRESDAWIIYYYAPIGTKIIIQYDLNVKNEKGKSNKLKDIYGYFSS
jgi:L,D-transpeptidase ErfK/SrfK